MSKPKRPITDEEIDALLTRTPVEPGSSFLDRTLVKSSPISYTEIDELLSNSTVPVSPDFTERTLARIEESSRNNLIEFPTINRWLIQAGMVAALLVIGLFSYQVWQSPNSMSPTPSTTKGNLANMELEELLYLEETLSSAKVLIELEKTVPLYVFLEEADT